MLIDRVGHPGTYTTPQNHKTFFDLLVGFGAYFLVIFSSLYFESIMSRNISFNLSITGILPNYTKAQQYHNYSFFSGVPYFKSTSSYSNCLVKKQDSRIQSLLVFHV